MHGLLVLVHSRIELASLLWRLLSVAVLLACPCGASCRLRGRLAVLLAVLVNGTVSCNTRLLHQIVTHSVAKAGSKVQGWS